jgi:REP element-mobilizing transposase RayT
MPRRLRVDYPGAWHHVMNRGVARRALFETSRDARMFLALLARRARAGDIEIHAYSLVTNHFHLLVRSPAGRLSRAMQRIQDAYSRWFNLTRGRDGPLFRGRFVNRVVENPAYWETVLRYIDGNAVSAGLAASPCDHPFGSARHYARRRGPPWLSRTEVEAWTTSWFGSGAYDPADYVRQASIARDGEWVPQRRLAVPGTGREDPLESLVGASAGRFREWLQETEVLADGPARGWILVGPRTIRTVLREWDSGEPPLPREGSADFDALEAGLLRRFCGLTFSEVAAVLDVTRPTVQSRVARYVAATRCRPGFMDLAARILETAVLRERPGGPPRDSSSSYNGVGFHLGR